LGKIDQALANDRQAAAWVADLPTDPDIESGLCWFGGLVQRRSYSETGSDCFLLTKQSKIRRHAMPTTTTTTASGSLRCCT